jgi:5'-nucleotidase
VPDRAPRPRILLANDDGVNSPGLSVLEEIARGMSDDVWIVAPDDEQSGAAHSLTINEPLRLRTVGERRYAVRGTPTDCVMLAVHHILRGQKRPDLLMSGINMGANLGEDVTYSGTVAAAMEGCLLGIRSIAFSQVMRLSAPAHWGTARTFAPRIIRRLMAIDWPPGVLINVNFPDRPPEGVSGVHGVYQGVRDPADLIIDERTDVRGVPYFWIGFRRNPYKPLENTDLALVEQGGIAVTPLRINLSDDATLARIKPLLTDLQ